MTQTVVAMSGGNPVSVDVDTQKTSVSGTTTVLSGEQRLLGLLVIPDGSIQVVQDTALLILI